MSKPFCGDGIVEGDEDCDCGTIFNCLSRSKNCFPSAGIIFFSEFHMGIENLIVTSCLDVTVADSYVE